MCEWIEPTWVFSLTLQLSWKTASSTVWQRKLLVMNKQMLKLQRSKKELPGFTQLASRRQCRPVTRLSMTQTRSLTIWTMHLRLRWKKSQGIIKHMDMYVQLMVCCLMEVCGEGVWFWWDSILVVINWWLLADMNIKCVANLAWEMASGCFS